MRVKVLAEIGAGVLVDADVDDEFLRFAAYVASGGAEGWTG